MKPSINKNKLSAVRSWCPHRIRVDDACLYSCPFCSKQPANEQYCTIGKGIHSSTNVKCIDLEIFSE